MNPATPKTELKKQSLMKSIHYCLLALTLVTLLATPHLHAASAGSLDTGFDPGTGPNTSGSISAAVAQSDGKVIVAGSFTNFNGVTHPGIVRLNENGSVDTGFNHGSGIGLQSGIALVLTAAVQSDQKILVGGGFNTYDGAPALGLLRLNTDGTVDSGFSQTSDQLIANSLSVLGNGKILVGLYDGPGLIRLNANGSIDTNFFLSTFGPSLNGFVNTIVVQPDGKILVSGNFTRFYSGINDNVGTARERIARLNADGTLDTTFDAGTGAVGGNGTVNGLALQSSGKIIVGGDFTNFTGVACGGVVRLNTNGTVDATFTSNPGTTTSLFGGVVVIPGPVFDVSVDPSDRVLLAGSFAIYNGVAVKNVVRLTPNGALDSTFVNIGPNAWTQTLFLQPNGKILVSGYFTNVAGVTRPGLARLNGAASTPVAPSITTQPVSQSVTNLNDPVGPTVTFTVGASGTDPFTYQWLYNNIPVADGVLSRPLLANGPLLASAPIISGAHTATLTISDVTARNAGKYSCIVSNAVGHVTSAQASLLVNGSLVPDLTRPTIVILSPAAPVTRVTSNMVNVAGTAADLAGVASVTVQVGTNDFVPANGTTSWSSTVTLTPGTNIFRAKATDLSGNTATNSKILIYVVTSPLTLLTNGNGRVTGATNGQLLEVGKPYLLTALPGLGHVFSNWTGSVTSQSNVLNFVMQSNFSLTANFVTNPFTPVAGIFNGLYYETNGVRHDASGFFTLLLKPDGKFTAKLKNGVKLYPFIGKFDLDGLSTNSVKRLGTNNVTVELVLDLHGGAETITGRVTDGSWTARLDADRAVFNALTHVASNFTNKYTLLIPGSTNAAVEPPGDSPGAVVVDALGGVKFSGFMADGTPAVQKATLSKNGAWPLYVPLYGGRGSLLGWVTFTNTVDPDLGGFVSWSKPASLVPKNYTNGFVVTPHLIGSVYRSPGTNKVLNFDQGFVAFTEGNLAPGFTNTVGLAASGKVTNASPNPLIFTVLPPTGQFVGTAKPPGTTQVIPFKGAILQKQGYGGGFFLSTNVTGRVDFGP